MYIQKRISYFRITWHEDEKETVKIIALTFNNNVFIYNNGDNKITHILKVNIVNHIQYGKYKG